MHFEGYDASTRFVPGAAGWAVADANTTVNARMIALTTSPARGPEAVICWADMSLSATDTRVHVVDNLASVVRPPFSDGFR